MVAIGFCIAYTTEADFTPLVLTTVRMEKGEAQDDTLNPHGRSSLSARNFFQTILDDASLEWLTELSD
jgi:hypothetical protein